MVITFCSNIFYFDFKKLISKLDNIDYVIANNGIIPPDIKEKYARENAELVVLDYENISNLNVNVIESDLIKITKRYVKHNAEKLAELIMKNI